MNSLGEWIHVDNLQSEDILSVRFVEKEDGSYAYQTYQSASPETTLDEVGTPAKVDHDNAVQSIVEDRVHHRVILTTMDGSSFTFRKARVMPTGISVLTNRIKFAQSSTASVEFRVNPSDASTNYDVSSPDCELSLDFLGAATRSGYVTDPVNYKLVGVEQVYDKNGARKDGQYRAYIQDLGVDIHYDELVALVLTVDDGLGRMVQYSSSAVELVYTTDIFTSFSFLKILNKGLLGDAVATIEGNNITIATPFIFDASSLIPTFTTGGSKVTVNGVPQMSGVSAQDFSQPVKYVVGENEYTVTLKRSGLPVVMIDTPDSAPIISKEIWTEKSSIVIYDSDGNRQYESSKLGIRGRGNVTWTYPKRPYAIKLEKKAEILGMPAHKRWVLLANWMDRTLMRNDVAFFISKQTGLAWTPRGQFVELVLNGQHMGNFYLCEQIKVDINRVNIKEMKASDTSGDALTGGYLIEVDTHFDETNRFRSAIRDLPYIIKEPDDDALQPEQFAYIQDYINGLEVKLYADNWLDRREYESYVDLPSFVDWLFVEELARNLDAWAPNSLYMYKDRLGKLTAGPVWDFDYSTFSYHVGWNDSVTRNAVYYDRLFLDPVFIELLKERWNAFKPLFNTVPDYIDSMAELLRVSNGINISMWPISTTENGDETLDYQDAIRKMRSVYLGIVV